MNICHFIGRLTADPELKYSQSGTAYCVFTLAIDRKTKDKETDFIRLKAFAKTAEFVANYWRKGQMQAATARVQTGSYQKDGQKVATTDFIVFDTQTITWDKAAKSQQEQQKAKFDNVIGTDLNDLQF
jgi:single-strand DNA-binding protein